MILDGDGNISGRCSLAVINIALHVSLSLSLNQPHPTKKLAPLLPILLDTTMRTFARPTHLGIHLFYRGLLGDARKKHEETTGVAASMFFLYIATYQISYYFLHGCSMPACIYIHLCICILDTTQLL